MSTCFEKFIFDFQNQLEKAWSETDVSITQSEYRYLLAIEAEEARVYDPNAKNETAHGQHLQNIVDILGFEKSSVSVMIAKLESKKWISKIQCQFDARSQHIVLTIKGREMLFLASSVLKNLELFYMQNTAPKAWEKFTEFLHLNNQNEEDEK